MSTGADTRIETIPSYEELALSRLAPQVIAYQPRLRALIQALSAGAQACEDELFDLLVSSGLDAATGATLTQWALIVGLERGPLDDLWLRRFVKAKLRANRSQSTNDDLIGIFGALMGAPAYTVANFPSSFYLFAVVDSPADPTTRREIARFMAAVKPAGGEMILMEALSGYQGFIGDPKSGVLSSAPLGKIITEAA
jgi:hypothetical protein